MDGLFEEQQRLASQTNLGSQVTIENQDSKDNNVIEVDESMEDDDDRAAFERETTTDF